MTSAAAEAAVSFAELTAPTRGANGLKPHKLDAAD
jgi:hypothetical protein